MKKSRIILYCIISIGLLLWWNAQFAGDKKVREEITIADGQYSFVATFDTISSIVMCNQELPLATELEDEGAAFTIVITELSEGAPTENTLLLETDAMKIHTNGYSSMDSCTLSELPVRLNVGSQYSIQCHGITPSGQNLDSISLILYGNERSTNFLTLILFVLADAGIGIWIFCGNFTVSFLILLLLNIILFPSLQSERELSAYADVYAASSTLLSRPVYSEDGGVLIEEAGIRNDGYTTYRNPMVRFWCNSQSGNDRTNAGESINYQSSGHALNLFQTPAVLAVALSRQLQLCYQTVRLAGSLINMMIALLILLWRKRITSQSWHSWSYWKAILLLPAVQISILSYTGYGLALLILGALLLTLQDLYLADRLPKKSRILLCGITIVILLYDIVMVIGWNSGNLHSIINSFVRGWDSYLNEWIVYDHYGYESLFVLVYILLGGILVNKRKMSFEIRKALCERGAKQYTDTCYTTLSIITFIACTFMAYQLGGIAYLLMLLTFLPQLSKGEFVAELAENSFRKVEFVMLLCGFAVALTRFAAL